jgi:hypothetical protein
MATPPKSETRQSTTPRRGRRKKNAETEPENAEEVEELEPSTSKGGDGATPVRSKKKSATATPPGAPSPTTNLADATFSPRELRQRHREQLRSKATGMISATSPAKNKKVIFDEDSVGADAVVAQPTSVDETRTTPAADAVVEAPSSPTDKARRKVGDGHNDVDEDDDDEDDDDGGVEEMTSKAARQEDLERREVERRTARAASQTAAKKSRKRRESKVEQQAEPNSDASSAGPEDATAMIEEGTDMDMDESFFAQLDEARETERKERRRRRLDDTAGMQRGKHTTFVVEGESSEAALHIRPIAKKVDHNVHVVVLPAAPANDDDFPALPPPIFTSEPVSSTALVCSRALLLDGSDVMSAKAQQKAKKNGVAHLVKDNAVPGWTRSKKMSFLASSKSRRKKGTAAPIFAVKK